jgi:hypothetical protein
MTIAWSRSPRHAPSSVSIRGFVCSETPPAPATFFAKAGRCCGQGVTFGVNRPLIMLLARNTAKTLTSEWESRPAAPRFGHTRPRELRAGGHMTGPDEGAK